MQEIIRVSCLWMLLLLATCGFASQPSSAQDAEPPTDATNVPDPVEESTALGGGLFVVKSIEFEGNREITDDVLRQRLSFEPGDRLDSFLAEGGRLTIADVHRQTGFAFVQVDLDPEKLAQGHILYIINEGARVRVSSVRFVGNRAIPASALHQVIKTTTQNWLLWPNYYTETAIEEDLDRLRTFYYKKGYLDYKIEAETQFSDDKSRVRVTFLVEEGPVYRIREIRFSGNEQYAADVLGNLVDIQAGQVYLKEDADKNVRKIARYYRERGYIDAMVSQHPQFDPDQDAREVAVEFRIAEGNRFRIGRIDVTGNETTQDKVVRRVLDEYGFTPGEWYDAGMAPKQGRGRLERFVQRVAVAEDVMIRPVTPPDGADDRKDVHVDVKEGMTGLVMPGIGVSSDSGVVGRLIYQQRNFDIQDWPESWGELFSMGAFRGAGQTLRLSLEPGTELSWYEMRFIDPYFWDQPLTFELTGAAWRHFRESHAEQRGLGKVTFEKREQALWRKSLTLRAVNVEVEDLHSDAPQEIRDVEGNNAVFGARLGLGATPVDDPYRPTTGYIARGYYEQVAGDFTFGILGGTYVHYFPLFEDVLERRTVLAARVLAETIVGDAPPFEKFYAGGSGTYGIRGFEYRGVSTRGLQVGPDVVDPQYIDPIGSDWIFLAGAELIIPLVGEEFSWLLFVDSGTVDMGKYRVSVGGGIQIILPQVFGQMPMRFELATPLRKDEFDERQVFSFSFGGLFR